ncbi:MAG: gamma-glutamyltransferase [Actinomycetota bacterium]|nr:gamma-glutamyltransferase [Actinomycetota bacterium]
MVASAHPAATAVGARVLEEGGNAIDAALAMAAVTWVAIPAQCGVGGDAFALVRDGGSGSVRAIHGSGHGPDGADLAFFAARGVASVPLTGPFSIAVPGAVSAVAALGELGASRPLAELFAPAAALARRGTTVSRRNAVDLAGCSSMLLADPGSASVFARGGRVAREAELLVQEDLAATIDAIGSDPDGFYRGALAERLVSALRSLGTPLSGEEWADQRALVCEPVTTRYAGHDVHSTLPPSPGYMIAQQLGLCGSALAGSALLGADAVATMARAAARSFADRFSVVGSDQDAWRSLLSGEAVASARAGLAGRPLVAPVHRGGDTTSFVVVDADHNAVSFIHSNAFTFGSGITVPGTGVLMNNRLARGAYLLDGHPNALAPRRRPMSTLAAWIATAPDGSLRAAGGTPGGDGQVQWNVQLLSHLLDHGLEPQEAVDAPRFSVAPGSDANAIESPLRLSCESRLGEEVVASLVADGLPAVTVGAWAGGGGAQVVEVRDGALYGGSDSRQDGHAQGS